MRNRNAFRIKPTLSLLFAFFALISSMASDTFAQRRTRPIARSQTSAKSITVQTEPSAIVWLDELRRGLTGESGKLVIKNVSAGRHTLRVRASGFSERTLPVLATERGLISVKLARTTDEAELNFQKAEEARERARDDETRNQAAELYRRALQLRSDFPAAHLGLARLLMDMSDYKSALAEIEEARATRPIYPEASAVEGRILREMAFEDRAIESFQRAIREAHGFQPEAHTGLARVYEDKGQLDQAAAEYRAAIAQLSDTEPVIYQLLGAVYEKLQKYREAVSAYEKYLELAPDGPLAPAIRSILDQLKQQAAEQATP
ncbi:MAG TPA: tetratricopeptide repeat protein [Pyrinomonadaceae bacterium]|nr:tetratricopeptide repeat protein [Pyrinomonadaceae bacterium]